MKTYKEIAELFGVTKDKIKYRARNLPDSYLEINRGITYVNTEGIEELRGFFEGKVERETTEEVTREVVSILRDELSAKNRQIDELTAALRAAQQTAAAAQALHAATVTQNLETDAGKPRDKGIFARIFGKISE